MEERPRKRERVSPSCILPTAIEVASVSWKELACGEDDVATSTRQEFQGWEVVDGVKKQ